jgi:hypothetical protein
MKAFRTPCVAVSLLAAVLAPAGATHAADDHPLYELAVSFDVAQARIEGRSRIEVRPGTTLAITRGDLRILSLRNGNRHVAPDPGAPDPYVLRAEGTVEIHYEGVFDGTDVDVIDPDRILLRNVWYPVAGGTYRYRLHASVPRDFTAISEGDRVRRTESGGRAVYEFDLPYPQRDWDGITFAASRHWVSRQAMHGDIPVCIYLLPGNEARLAETLAQAESYLSRLERLLGPYPFRRLVIAENPVALDYSLAMPTYILLSQQSAASETPDDSSLNHEIAHSWFGNAVLADYEGGNWAEGLATYFSDHLENERLGRAWQRRQHMLAAHQSFVVGRREAPLSSFAGADDRASRIAGYAKAALVVHMLRRTVGDEPFFSGMRRFVRENLHREASWTGLRRALEAQTGSDLRWFFAQWVDGVATPELGLEGVSAAPAGSGYELRMTLTQKTPVLGLAVPLTLHFDDGSSAEQLVPLSEDRRESRFILRKRPVRVVLDAGYDIIRRLAPAEVPPIIAALLARPRVTVVGAPEEQARFGALIDAFEREGSSIVLRGERAEWLRREPPVRSEAIAPGAAWRRPAITRATDPGAALAGTPTSVILLGNYGPLAGALYSNPALANAGFSMKVVKHPRSAQEMVAILAATSRAEVDAAYAGLVGRPRYSAAAFVGGRLTYYELATGERGISRDVGAKTRP